MRLVKAMAKRAARTMGLSLVQSARLNRFDATGSVLRQLAERGYLPEIVIDVGANVGQWTNLASRIFPQAEFHLVEPQRGCHEALARFPAPRFTVHRVAVTAPGVADVRMIGGGTAADSTGAFVTGDRVAPPDARIYPATTLDQLFSTRVSRTDRSLLKLDVEGHELAALQGAAALLGAVECIFTEARFFDVHHSGSPVFADLVLCLRDYGFELHDVATLSGRASDNRLRLGDFVFVRRSSPLVDDVSV